MKTILSTMAIALMAAATATAQFNAASYPPPNAVPPVDSPQVKEWLKAVDLSKVPVFPTHSGEPPACPAVTSIPADQCWRSCQSCRGDDVVACPAPGVMGLTFDDGKRVNPTQPSPSPLSVIVRRLAYEKATSRRLNLIADSCLSKNRVPTHTYTHKPSKHTKTQAHTSPLPHQT